MLKPADPLPPGEPDGTIGELIERLLDDALAYGRAEFELARARIVDSVESYRRAVILFAVAAVIALAGVVTLFVGTALALGRWIGPLGGTLIVVLLTAIGAGMLIWFALRDLERPK